MKLTYIEIEATAEELHENPTLMDALRNALIKATGQKEETPCMER